MNHLKYFFSIALGLLLSYLRLYGFAYTLVGAAVAMDLVTGVLASLISGEGLSRARAAKGVLKKLSLFAALLFGTFLDMFIPYAASQAGLKLSEGLVLSGVISVYIVVTECVSVIENVLRCNSGAIPAWVRSAFTAARTRLEKGGGKND